MFSFGYSNSFTQKEHYIIPFKNDFKEIVKKSAAAVSNSMYISFSIIQFTLKPANELNLLTEQMPNENSLFSDKQAQKY